jgi:hypothetical protein
VDFLQQKPFRGLVNLEVFSPTDLHESLSLVRQALTIPYFLLGKPPALPRDSMNLKIPSQGLSDNTLSRWGRVRVGVNKSCKNKTVTKVQGIAKISFPR